MKQKSLRRITAESSEVGGEFMALTEVVHNDGSHCDFKPDDDCHSECAQFLIEFAPLDKMQESVAL